VANQWGTIPNFTTSQAIKNWSLLIGQSTNLVRIRPFAELPIKIVAIFHVWLLQDVPFSDTYKDW